MNYPMIRKTELNNLQWDLIVLLSSVAIFTENLLKMVGLSKKSRKKPNLEGFQFSIKLHYKQIKFSIEINVNGEAPSWYLIGFEIYVIICYANKLTLDLCGHLITYQNSSSIVWFILLLHRLHMRSKIQWFHFQ